MSITTIVHFEVPAENVDAFFDFWQTQIRDVTGSQPGLIGGVFHRCIDPDSPFQFVNVAQWDTPESLDAAIKATVEILEQDGTDMMQVFDNLGVKASQNNYIEAVRYAPSSHR